MGDVLQCSAMKGHGEIHDFRPWGVGRVLATVLRAPRFLGAIFGYAISFFAFLRLVSITAISFAVPATAVSYVFETLIAKYLLHERVTWKRWAGAALVACGVILLSLS